MWHRNWLLRSLTTSSGWSLTPTCLTMSTLDYYLKSMAAPRLFPCTELSRYWLAIPDASTESEVQILRWICRNLWASPHKTPSPCGILAGAPMSGSSLISLRYILCPWQPGFTDLTGVDSTCKLSTYRPKLAKNASTDTFIWSVKNSFVRKQNVL